MTTYQRTLAKTNLKYLVLFGNLALCYNSFQISHLKSYQGSFSITSYKYCFCLGFRLYKVYMYVQYQLQNICSLNHIDINSSVVHMSGTFIRGIQLHVYTVLFVYTYPA